MVTGQWTFIVDTGDGTDREAGDSSKHKRTVVKVTEDLLMNRQIIESGLCVGHSGRSKTVVWYFLKKYGSKKVKDKDDNLKLPHHVLSMMCLVHADQERRLYYTVNY